VAANFAPLSPAGRDPPFLVAILDLSHFCPVTYSKLRAATQERTKNISGLTGVTLDQFV